MRSEAWVDANVRTGHGALGAVYPQANIPGIKEGDTPSFLHLLPTGLGDPEHPEWGGWGGRFRRFAPDRNSFVDARDQHPGSSNGVRESQWTVGRWNEAASCDFAARMDWCVADEFKQANHPPVAVLNGDQSHKAVVLAANPGETVTLSSDGSTDPDGNALDVRWFIYREAGTNAKDAELSAATGASVRLMLPRELRTGVVHVILALSDNGAPPLTRYRRALVEVRP